MKKNRKLLSHPNKQKTKYIEFADTINNKFPIDTPQNIYTTWRFFHLPHNYQSYIKEEANIIEARIIKAWKEKISPLGPPNTSVRKFKKGV